MRGYTTFTQERGDEAAATLAMRFASIARASLEAGGGTGLEFRGDEVLAVFTSARQAIRAAVDLQSAFVQASIDDPAMALPVGIGLDAGEAVEVSDGYRGGALNLAARLCSIAGPGEILASDSVVHLARKVDGVSGVDRGTATLKGLAEPVRLTLLTKEGWDPATDEAFQQAIGRSAGRIGTAFAVCPYRGLAAFQPEDADRFFGRDELVAELVERLDRDRVLFVVGPSGSGKSSAVRAGLIPAVGRGAVAGSDRWAAALFSPRSSPSSELSYQLHRAAEQAGVRAPGGAEPSTSTNELRTIADAICDATGGLLIVIDQFEELFTLNPHREQEAFVKLLAAIADPPASRVRVVMAMRADFYGVCATFPWLVRRATANQALVGPMSRADLRKVIEQPAASSGLRLEDGLVDAVLEDAGTDAAALPLISHAMAETWRRRDGQMLSLQGYRDAGGVAGSISQTADTLYETALSESEQDACRRLMLRLVAPGEGTSDTRRRLPLRELDRDREPDRSRRVASEMTDARLLTVDRDSLEIAHEALLRSWPRLRRWIDESRDELRTRQRIGHAAAEWHAQERDPDLLYRGTPLRAAREWAEDHGDSLGPEEQAFLTASVEAFDREQIRLREASRRSRRLRRVAVSVLGGLTVAAVVASLIAFSALGESRQRYAESLATQALALADSDPRTAIALAAEAMTRTGTDPADARAALVEASEALAAPFVPSGPAVQVGDASTVVVSPDGSLIVTGNLDGSISTWSTTGKALATDVPGHTGAIQEMDFAPDGRRLISGGDDAAVFLWDLSDPSDVPDPTKLGTASGIPVWSVTVAPDGRTAASASEDGTINLWDLESQRPIDGVFADLAFDTITASFSPDGDLLLIGNGLGEVTGLSVDDGSIAIPTFQAHGSDVWEIEFSDDGSLFATASSDGRVRVWETASADLVDEPFERTAFQAQGVLMLGDEVVAGDEQGRLLVAPIDGTAPPTVSAPRAAQIDDAAWGGGVLATLGEDQRLQLWSPSGEPTAVLLDDQPGGAFGLAASPDGARLAVGDGKGTVRVYSSTTGEMTLGPLGLHDGPVRGLAFSDDGIRLASVADDGSISVIDAETGQPLGAPPSGGEAVTSVLWADDRLVTGGADGMVRIWSGGTIDAELGPHAGDVTSIARAPDGTVAVADASGQVWFWTTDGEQIGEPLVADDTAIWGVDWSTDGTLLAAASDDREVSLWDVETRTKVGVLTPQPGGGTDVAFLDDGDSIVSTTRDGVVRLWDVAADTPLGGELRGHQLTSWRAVALPGMRFATSSQDGTVRIWDLLNLDRACERAAGMLGIESLGPYLGDEVPIACTGG